MYMVGASKISFLVLDLCAVYCWKGFVFTGPDRHISYLRRRGLAFGSQGWHIGMKVLGVKAEFKDD